MKQYCPALTPREYEVLLLTDSWLMNREIAAKLSVTEDTVKTHLRHIYWKLGVSCRREAVETAYRRGILRPEA